MEYFSIDIETDGLNRKSEIFCAATASSCKSTEFFMLDRYGDNSGQAGLESRLDSTVFNPRYGGIVICHNAVFDIPRLWHRFRGSSAQIQLCPRIHDTMALSRLIRNSKTRGFFDEFKRSAHSLKFLTEEYLGISHSTFEDVTGLNSIRLADRAKLETYNREDARLTLKLHDELVRILDEQEIQYFHDFEVPHTQNIIFLAMHGLRVDLRGLETLRAFLEDKKFNLERYIWRRLSRTISLSSPQAISRAIYQNSALKLRHSAGAIPRPFGPLEFTETGGPSADGKALKLLLNQYGGIEGNEGAIELVQWLIEYAEIETTLEKLDEISQQLVYPRNQFPSCEGTVYPNISASAVTGRVQASKPNVLAIPKKIFKRAEPEYIYDLPFKSVRNLIVSEKANPIVSIDINGLDLGVLAWGASRFRPDSDWVDFFRNHGTDEVPQYIDPHLNVLRKLDPELVAHHLKPLHAVPKDLENYWICKIDKKNPTIKLIPRTKSALVFESIYANEDDLDRLFSLRDAGKQINLGVSYLMGPTGLAKKLREVAAEDYSLAYSKKLLKKFYEEYFEIREFQDSIAAAILNRGFERTPFGRKIWEPCWGYLSQHKGALDFVIKIDSKFWLVSVIGLRKENCTRIVGMESAERLPRIGFDKVLHLTELPSVIFKAPSIISDPNKSSETAPGDEEFELPFPAITDEIDRFLRWNQESKVPDYEFAHSHFIHEGKFCLPESKIKFYRYSNAQGSGRFFRKYTSLQRAAKTFFPAFCQSVATDVAKRTLTHVRSRLTEECPEARILLFVHDSIDVECHERDTATVQRILTEAVSLSHEEFGFNIRYTGTIEIKNGRYS